MEKIFCEYLDKSENDLNKIYLSAIVIFDTNIILDLYYYEKTREKYFKILNALKEKKRLFMPYQIGKEYFKNRERIVEERITKLEETRKIVQNLRNKTISSYNIFDDLGKDNDYSSYIQENILSNIDLILNDIKLKINKEDNSSDSYLNIHNDIYNAKEIIKEKLDLLKEKDFNDIPEKLLKNKFDIIINNIAKSISKLKKEKNTTEDTIFKKLLKIFDGLVGKKLNPDDEYYLINKG